MTEGNNNARGVIVALLPDSDYTQYRPTIADHHLTAVILGMTDDEALNDDALERFWHDLIYIARPKIHAEASAQSVFDAGSDRWAYVDLINSHEMCEFRADVCTLIDYHGLPRRTDYGFMPHITTMYAKNPNPVELLHRRTRIPFYFDRLALWAGDNRRELELT